MGRIAPKDFVSCRVRLQRIRDAKIFNGWVKNFFGNRLEVDIASDTAVEIGDRFRVEAFGRRGSAVFEASLSSVERFDLSSGGIMTAIEGTSARMIEAKVVSIALTPEGAMRYGQVSESCRIRVSGTEAKFGQGSFDQDAVLIDLSLDGFAIMTRNPAKKGELIDFELATSVGMIRGKGMVRNSRPVTDRPGLFRVGVSVEGFGRLDAPRWNRFVNEA